MLEEGTGAARDLGTLVPTRCRFVQLELLRPAAAETAVIEAAAAALVDVVLLLRRDAGPKRLDDDGLDRLGHGVGYRAARRRLRSRAFGAVLWLVVLRSWASL